MAKSTFVTAPSFASSSSVTSINHVPRPSVPLLPCPPLLGTLPEPPVSSLHTAPSSSIAAHPIFRHRPVPHFPSISFSPFFFLSLSSSLVRSYTSQARVRAHTLSRKCIHRAKMKFGGPSLSDPSRAAFSRAPVIVRRARSRGSRAHARGEAMISRRDTEVSSNCRVTFSRCNKGRTFRRRALLKCAKYRERENYGVDRSLS